MRRNRFAEWLEALRRKYWQRSGYESLLKISPDSFRDREAWPSGEQSGRHWRPGPDVVDMGHEYARIAGTGVAGGSTTHITPTLTTAGTLDCRYDPRQQHVMLTVGHRSWPGLWVVPKETEFRIDMRFRLLGDVVRWSQSDWLIPVQLWSPQAPDGKRAEPPISLIVLDGAWYVRVLIGDRHEEGERNRNEFYIRAPRKPSNNWTQWSIEYRQSATAGHVKAVQDGEALTEYEGPTVTTLRGRPQGQLLTFGYYSYSKGGHGIGVEHSDFEVLRRKP